jgi:menaquinone-dependent protoporphyrinogen oxidase
VHILIVYGTSEGQSRKVAELVAERLRAAGHTVTLVDAVRQPVAPRVAGFDGAIIAARVHAGLYQRQIMRFVRANRATLDTIPNAFVSVSMSAARLSAGDNARLRAYVSGFVRRSGWTPARVYHVAGARLYTRHGPIGRWILGLVDGNRFATDRDHEWTDWTALGKFADEFAMSLKPDQPGAETARPAEPLDTLD